MNAIIKPGEQPPLVKLAYTITEVVHATSLSRTTIYSHIASGNLKAKRIGGRTVILDDDLREFLNSAEPIAIPQAYRGGKK